MASESSAVMSKTFSASAGAMVPVPQAGVIMATAFILFGMVYGPQDLGRVAPPRAVELGVAAGPLLYGGVGLVSLARGRNFLDYSALSPEHPVHGQHLGILL